jgi:hypothetical protein
MATRNILPPFYDCVTGDQTKGEEMGGTCRTHEEMREAYKVVVGKPDGNRPWIGE